MLLYSVTFDNVSVTAATDLFHLTVTADSPVELFGMTVSQVGTADVGDAQEELLRIGLHRAVTGGSGGTAATENAWTNARNPTAATAILTNNTTASTSGTLLEIIPFNVRIPLMWFPIPELRPWFDSSDDPVAMRLLGAPADAITLSGTIWWREW